jgi:uncharacterized membrane protein
VLSFASNCLKSSGCFVSSSVFLIVVTVIVLIVVLYVAVVYGNHKKKMKADRKRLREIKEKNLGDTDINEI